jgi:hypothetical protein
MGFLSNIKNKFVKKDQSLESLMTRDNLLRLRFGTILDYRHINDVSIMLGENEYCFYKDKSFIYEEKEEIVGYKSRNDGVSIRIANGFSYRTGNGDSKAIKKVKEIEHKGILYLTNKRVIYVCDKVGFEKKITDITSIQGAYSFLILQIGSKTYKFTTPSADEFIVAFKELCNIDVTKLPEPSETTSNAYDGEITFESGRVDPLYYLVGSALIKTDGYCTYIHRKLFPIKYIRMLKMYEDLIKDGVIADERTEDGRYKVIMSYKDWLENRVKNKQY